MKNLFKKLLSIITAILFLGIFPITSFAMSKSYLSREIINTETLADGTVLKTINNSNLKKVQNKSLASGYDEAKNIMEELGIKINENLESHKKVLECVNSARSISVISQYIKIDKNGVQTVLSEEECIKKIEQDKALTVLNNLWFDGVDNISEDGYMQQGIAVIYTGEEPGKYVIIGQHEWLKDPSTRLTDAYSLYSPDLRWPNIKTNSYCKVLSYTKKDYIYGDEEVYEEEMIDPKVLDTGVYYSVELPRGAGSHTICTDIYVQIFATAELQSKSNLNQTMTVYSKYVHDELGVALDFGWTVGSSLPGVTIVGALLKKEYGLHYTWHYYG